MANYRSQPTSAYKENPIPTYNTELMGKALEYKNTKAEINISNTQEQINQIAANVDIARDVDKNYFSERMTAAVNKINNMSGSLDWASSSSINIASSSIQEAIDNNVLTAVASTKNLRKLQSDIEEIKTKHPDKYSPLNEAFAMRGAQEWLSNQNVGVGYKGGTYNPYEDVAKSMISIVKDLKETKGDQVIEVPIVDAQGNRRIVKKTIKGLTSEEIVAYLPDLIPPTTRQQLQINGWSRYQGEGGLSAAQEVFSQYSSQQNSSIDKAIEIARIGETSTNLSKSERQRYANKKQGLLRQKELLNNELGQVDINDTASLGGFIETHRFINNFAEMASARTSVEYETDDAFYAQRNLELAYRREDRADKEFKLDTVKTSLEIAKLEAEMAEKNATNIAITPLAGETPETFGKETASKLYWENANQMKANISQAVTQSDKDSQNLYNNKREEYRKKGFSDNNAAYFAFRDIYKTSKPEAFARVSDLYAKKEDIAVGYQNAVDESLREGFQDKSKGYYEGLLNLSRAGEKEVDNFLKANNITQETFNSSGTDIKIIRKAADLLKKYSSNKKVATSMGQNVYSTPQGTSFASSIRNVRFGGVDTPLVWWVNDPYEEANKSVTEKLKDKGYLSFNEFKAANIVDKKTRETIANSINQYGTEGFVFDPDAAMSITVNPDGNLLLTQATEVKKAGVISPGAPRTATISKNSTLYNLLNSKIDFQINNQYQQNAYRPTIKAKSVDFIDDSDSETANKNAAFITNKFGNESWKLDTNVSVNPLNYLTDSSTSKAYSEVLKNRVAQEKIKTLTTLLKNNSNALSVTSKPNEQGMYSTEVFLNGKSRILLDKTNFFDDAEKVRAFTDQYPQTTASHALLKYLYKNPDEIDNVISSF